MILKISSWYGRLGNNILQVKNVISIALYYNYNIIIPTHKFFNKKKIILNREDTANEIFEDNFFYVNKIERFDSKCYNLNIEKTLTILNNLFTIKYNKLEALNNDDLVIHIRSGDLFTLNPPPEMYISPPLSYYQNIIENGLYKNIYLIAEDTKNPCINKLLELYPKISFKINDLETDIKYILRARNIVSSIGSFISSLLFFTKYTKIVYTPSNNHYDRRYFDNIKIIRTDLTEYLKIIDKWKNTDEQKKIMLTYV